MNWKISNDDTGAASNDNDNNGKDDTLCKSTSVLYIDWYYDYTVSPSIDNYNTRKLQLKNGKDDGVCKSDDGAT